ncbi:MAG: PIN domain-containing protein [candidate division WOR-3 bacterium]
MKTYLDTSALYAILSKRDAFHERATMRYQELVDGEAELWTNSLVFGEIVALVCQRAGRLEGIKVGMWLLDNIRIHWLGEDELREIMRLAEAPDEPRLSLVDWALVYLARQENACVFTYDDKMRETDIRILS